MRTGTARLIVMIQLRSYLKRQATDVVIDEIRTI
jgi:hypothetical protein